MSSVHGRLAVLQGDPVVAWLQCEQCSAVQQRCRVAPPLLGCQARLPPNLAVQQLIKWPHPCLAVRLLMPPVLGCQAVL